MLAKLNVEEFIKELASSSPTPGGGSVAALSASLAGALNSMVYSLTVGKKAYENLAEDLKDKLNGYNIESKDFYENALTFMDKDKEVFNKVIAAYKLPKDTDEQKNEREEKINDALIDAMYVPLELMKYCIKFYDNIDFAADYGNKNAVSDAGVAAIMLHAGIEGAMLNVKINLASIKNEDIIKEVSKEAINILETSGVRKEEILNKVYKYIG
ncbi:formiminotransferase-cyclodeaminase [Clostridium polyendosporum]|uniref:Formiminotransferase-cyclodeaminase n=1 Tax=Clostridium polyendosporum TaxID=69208 RepID=A0A919VGJ9_9CLOT|nr:cyclodeaminase/cyclohydrolase family protein [Clostridium polyendosporum]GIM28711.1 formiminotransferase-cyclodeaminase [Clostridium polyendosporum]